MFYVPKYFIIQELFPPNLLVNGVNRLMRLLDPRLTWTIDAIRVHYDKPMIINDYLFGGDNEHRGFRRHDCTVGATYSQHKFGRAVDFNIKDISAQQICDDIINNPRLRPFRHITCIEVGRSWVHIDVRNYDKKNGLLILS